jgi:hypothetical protein
VSPRSLGVRPSQPKRLLRRSRQGGQSSNMSIFSKAFLSPSNVMSASPPTLRSASRHTMLAPLYTHPNTVLGRLLCIYAFKTTGELRSLNDISRPGPDKPLRISASGRPNLARLRHCVQWGQGTGQWQRVFLTSVALTHTFEGASNFLQMARGLAQGRVASSIVDKV